MKPKNLEHTDAIAVVGVDIAKAKSNRRSVRVLKKLGLKLIGGIMLEGYTYADHLYAMDVSDIGDLSEVTAST